MARVKHLASLVGQAVQTIFASPDPQGQDIYENKSYSVPPYCSRQFEPSRVKIGQHLFSTPRWVKSRWVKPLCPPKFLPWGQSHYTGMPRAKFHLDSSKTGAARRLLKFSRLRHWGANTGLRPLQFLRHWIQHLYRYHPAKFQLSSSMRSTPVIKWSKHYLHIFQHIFGSRDPQGHNFRKFFSPSVSGHSRLSFELSCIKFERRSFSI